MGMSASQMRYCMIAGRKSDVEFQGQQINQQRTTLATQSSAYNTQFLTMDVPTPPSSDQFTETAYTFSSNGQTCNITGTVYDKSTGTYDVNYTTNAYTSRGKSAGSSTFGKEILANGSIKYTTNQGTTLTLVNTDPTSADYNATDDSNIQTINNDCGNAASTVYFKYTSGDTTKYVKEDDLVLNAGNGVAIGTYYVDDNATETAIGKLTGAEVTWTETGRMSSITDSQGNDYTLSTTTTSNTDAYDDAMNEYEYQKGLYDKEMDDINAQISIIESQDKKLELKLKDLDTQQEALNTEMESVKKVIDKNIEASFKAFA